MHPVKVWVSAMSTRFSTRSLVRIASPYWMALLHQRHPEDEVVIAPSRLQRDAPDQSHHRRQAVAPPMLLVLVTLVSVDSAYYRPSADTDVDVAAVRCIHTL
jgi:hypothetical protein